MSHSHNTTLDANKDASFAEMIYEILDDLIFFCAIEESKRTSSEKIYLNDICEYVESEMRAEYNEQIDLGDLSDAAKMRGLLIRTCAHFLGELVIIGIEELSDIAFVLRPLSVNVTIVGAPELPMRDRAFGLVTSCISPQAGVRLFLSDNPTSAFEIFTIRPAVIFVNLFASRVDLLNIVAKTPKASGGILAYGLTLDFDRMFDSGVLRGVAGLARYPIGNDRSIVHIPLHCLEQMKAEQNSLNIPRKSIDAVISTRYSAAIYRFPDGIDLASVADESLLLSPESAVLIKSPVFRGGYIPELAEASRVQSAAMITAPRFALSFDNLKVTGDGVMFTEQGYVFDGYYLNRRTSANLLQFSQIYWSTQLINRPDGAVYSPQADNVISTVEEACFLIGAPTAVFDLFAHFSLDFLPRFQDYVDLKSDDEPVFVSSRLKGWQRKAVNEVYELPEPALRTFNRSEGATLFRRATVIPGSWKLEGLAPSSVQSYRKLLARPSFGKSSTKARPGRIFTSRRDTRLTNPRLMLNLDEVSAYLRSRGFTEIIMSEHNIIDQMLMFRDAECIVGELGSSMQPIGCCQDGVKLVWVFGERAVEYYTYFMCHYSTVVGAEYAMIGCEQLGWPYNSHFIVDLDVLGNALDALNI